MMVARPALIIYSFAPKVIPNNQDMCAQAHDYLRGLWRACDNLGMIQEVPGLGLPTEFPTFDVSNPLFRLLAAKVNLKRRENKEHYQAFLFEYHDIAGFVATLEMNTPATPISTWKALLNEWTSTAGPVPMPPGMMDEIYLFTAFDENNILLSDSSPNDGLSAAIFNLGKEVSQALPGNHGPRWRVMSPYISDAGYCIWGGEPINERRTVALLAPQANEAGLFKWTVWPDEHSLAPFARYLLHGAKLRFAQRVFQNDIAKLHENSDGLDQAMANVFSVYQQSEDRMLKQHEITKAHNDLMREQQKDFGLMCDISRLNELGLTSRIATRNMRKLVPEKHPKTISLGDDTLFERDRARSLWLTEQIQMDLGYLRALRQRVSEGHKVATLLHERETQKTSQHLKNLVLVQGSLISAIALGLAALQVFNPDKATIVVGALIMLLMAIALALPVLIEHWHERYALIDRIMGGLLGATTLYLLAALFDKFWLHFRDTSISRYVLFSIFLSIVGFVLGLLGVRGLEKLKSR